MQPISIIVHTRNEESQIEDCLAGLRSWASEVIVCDMSSSDRTVFLATPLAHRILSLPFMAEFDASRNVSAAEAIQPWILFLDADERLTDEVKETIANLVALDDPTISAYQLPFKTISFGRWIEHAGNWWPSYKSPPLLRKGRFWFSGRVHDPARVDGRVIRIAPRSENDAIEHYSHRDLGHYLEKLNRYTMLEVEKLDASQAPTWEVAASRFGGMFRWFYDETNGQADGRAGFLLAFGSAMYEAVVQLKAMERSGAESIPPSAEAFLVLAAQAAAGSSQPVTNHDLSIAPGMAIRSDQGNVRLTIVDRSEPLCLNWETEAGLPSIHVATATHRNALRVLGGGEVQLFESVRALYDHGVGCSVGVGAVPDEGDLIHVYSLHTDDLVEQLRSSGRPYVLSPIYWDRAELAWVAPRLISAIAGAETFTDISQAFSSLRSQADAQRSEGFISQLSESQKTLVRGATRILPNAACEAEKLRLSMGEDTPPVQVVNNAIRATTELEPLDGLPDEPFVLCVGRIEANKNQLSLILACRMLSMPLVLIGHEPDPHYAELCRRVADDKTTVLGPRSRGQVAFAMKHAAVHCLPSFAETPGLVSLEAVTQGCALVCSNRGAEREYFGDTAVYCDPLNLESISESIEKTLKSPRRSTRPVQTWKEVAASLKACYESILSA